MRSAETRGRIFRSNYFGLLSDENEKDVRKVNQQIKSYSSPKRRNLVSLFMRLKGMFPKLEIYNQIILNETDFVKFLQDNFETEIPKENLMFNVMENLKCREKIFEILSKTKRLSDVSIYADRLIIEHEKVFKKYFDSLPEDMHAYLKVFYVADFIERLIENKVEIDKNDFELKNLLSTYYRLIVDLTADEPNLNRVFTSRIYESILNHFESKINGQNQKKLILYSAHDITMSAFIHSIGANMKEFHYDFNDEINFVLLEVDEEYYFSIKYNDKELPISFCNNKRLCEYQKLKDFLIENISSENEVRDFCEGKLEKLTDKEDNMEIINTFKQNNQFKDEI